VCRFCPNCGYDVERYEKAITIGRLTVTEDGVMVDGKPFHMTTDQVRLLRTIALAAPHPVRMDALILRLGKEDLEDPANNIQVQLSRVRHALRFAGLPEGTLQNLYGRGYLLTDATEQAA